MPVPVTIILPLLPGSVAACRDYLKANADPRPDFADSRLQCQPLFPFDELAELHFCSFVILPADDVVGPQLVFEATIDGGRTDFLRGLLRVAADGMHDVLRHCVGYPPTGLSTPDLVVEYLESRDVGADTYFSGAPGRSAAQIQDEGRLQRGIVAYLRERWQDRAGAPGRLPAIFAAMRRDLVCGCRDNRWAAAPAVMPWEMRARGALAVMAGVTAAVLACVLGAGVVRLCPWLDPWSIYGLLMAVTDDMGRYILGGSGLLTSLASAIAEFQVPHLLGLTALWIVARCLELLLDALAENPRDQKFMLNIPLQVISLLRRALVIFLAGSVLSLVITGLQDDARRSGWHAVAFALAVGVVTVAIVAILQHRAGSLRLMSELRPLSPALERARRFRLDVANYFSVLALAVGLMLLARQTPIVLAPALVGWLRLGLSGLYVLMVYALVGAVTAYAAGTLFMLLVRLREWQDTRAFVDAAELMARAEVNAPKYAREEGGSNTYQNHLASIVHVKGGLLRRVLLWLALWGVNLLARFWFNRGELGGIPTILSARWVVIDRGRRLLFLDNFGGAWESYLNEFIDLPGYKGLNAIWSNTFVTADDRHVGFPATQFLFWGGSQSEQPFKAYVRESQVETLVWYGAYPTLSTVNINANTDLRQAMGRALAPDEVDAMLQRL